MTISLIEEGLHVTLKQQKGNSALKCAVMLRAELCAVLQSSPCRHQVYWKFTPISLQLLHKCVDLFTGLPKELGVSNDNVMKKKLC